MDDDSEKTRVKNERARLWHLNHLERSHANHSRWRKQRWAYHLLRNARQSSKARGHAEPTLTEDWILERFALQAGRCHWTGIPMRIGGPSRDLFQPSLDRVDRALGYMPENVVLTSWGTNAARQSSTVDEFKAWLEAIRKQ